MKLYFTGGTDTGLVRSSNQDSHCIDPEGRFFIVADGMGGHAGGQEASAIAVKTIEKYLSKYWDSPKSSPWILEQSILEANRAILKDQDSHPERADMGTTVVAIMFRPPTADPQGEPEPWCAHVGDSRLYRLRGASLVQITEDHTWVNRALRLGNITPDQCRTHPWRHVLSQCLGQRDLQEIHVQLVEVLPGDRLLLCSDGLTEEVPDDIIAQILKKMRASDMVVNSLISLAKERGGRDNITVVALVADMHQ
ncbi:MAG: PP2C family protein-serine/threonine phosphatase [Prochlorotrichaceae cyanobacterium]|jgi:serine/threonine protein phosphatase PrpC